MDRTPQQDLVDKSSIGELIATYCHHADSNDVPGLVGLFAPDCRVDLGGGWLAGRDALAAFVRRGLSRSCSATLHLTGGPVIDLIGADRARSTVSVHAWHRLTDGTEADLWGEYRDLVVRTEAGWRFRERVLVVAGHRGLGSLRWQPLRRREGET